MPEHTHLDNLRVVLVDARNPLNIGAAARAMSNFGFRHLRLVTTYDLSFREARSAVGAADVLAEAKVHPTVAEAVADCGLVVGTTGGRARELHHSLKVLPAGGTLIRKELNSGPVGLLFGSEKRGLSNDDMTHCHWLMRIPSREAHSSMNLGQAVAICLYELIRRAPAKQASEIPNRATAASIQRIADVLFEALSASGYVKPNTLKSTEEKAHRLVRRLNLEVDDAELLLGMLRQMLWKIRSSETNSRNI